jgi:hypothetical protein
MRIYGAENRFKLCAFHTYFPTALIHVPQISLFEVYSPQQYLTDISSREGEVRYDIIFFIILFGISPLQIMMSKGVAFDVIVLRDQHSRKCIPLFLVGFTRNRLFWLGTVADLGANRISFHCF